MTITSTIWDVAQSTLALIKSYLGGDVMENEEPVHDAVKDINANNWNLIVAGLSECAKRLRHGNLVCIAFEFTDLAGTATNACTLLGSGITTPETAARLFKDGTLVAISAKMSENKTAGTLTVQPKIASGNCALTMTIADATDGNRAYQVVDDAAAADVVDASALDDIEVDVITSGFTPTTADITVWLWFNVGEEEDI